MTDYKISDEKFIEAFENATNIRTLLDNLGLAAAGGNYYVAKLRMKRLGLSTDHFTRRTTKGRQLPTKASLDDYLSNKVRINSNRLRKRLLREGIFEYKCYSCNLSTWLGKPISLELEHINGVSDDNTLTNLTLLCPNCHAQTDTYRGKNKRKK